MKRAHFPFLDYEISYQYFFEEVFPGKLRGLDVFSWLEFYRYESGDPSECPHHGVCGKQVQPVYAQTRNFVYRSFWACWFLTTQFDEWFNQYFRAHLEDWRETFGSFPIPMRRVLVPCGDQLFWHGTSPDDWAGPWRKAQGGIAGKYCWRRCRPFELVHPFERYSRHWPGLCEFAFDYALDAVERVGIDRKEFVSRILQDPAHSPQHPAEIQFLRHLQDSVGINPQP